MAYCSAGDVDMAKYIIMQGIFKGLRFNGTPIVISGEERIWNDDSQCQAFPAADCEGLTDLGETEDEHYDKLAAEDEAERAAFKGYGG